MRHQTQSREQSTVSKTDKLVSLFADDFITHDFFSKGRAKDFKCPLLDKCAVNKAEEPIWSPALGDESTTLMIVGEAPSRRKKVGAGPHIGGQFKDWTEGVALQSLLRFAKTHFNTVPHFTDVMKCGVASQTRAHKKAVFETRTRHCSQRFLFREIEIIDPETILCLGRTSFDTLKKAQQNGSVKPSIKLVNLIHYGKQAGLPLTAEDKETILWPLQLGKISVNAITDLSAVKKIIRNNKPSNDT